MNWEHLKAFLWLRWRLVANRNRRSGTGAVILQRVFKAIGIALSLSAFFGGILAGYFLVPQASANAVMLGWDVIVVAFLFLWMTELLIELQRSELLSLDKFLHLPVALSTAFLINYIGSISSVGALLFLPMMLGLAIGLVFGKGVGMLLLFPLIAAFALMVTALTHQFRGWLASLMVNKRRRRTIISLATVVFILIVQLPNFLGSAGFARRLRGANARQSQMSLDIQKLDEALARHEITIEEHERRKRELRGLSRSQDWQSFVGIATRVNRIVPLGWLPYGAASAFDGNAVPGLLGIAGLALIGAASLRRSYATTVRLYTGQFSAKPATESRADTSRAVQSDASRVVQSDASRAVQSDASRAVIDRAYSKAGKYPAAFLERKLPRLSEQASAITFANLRAIVRAPEAKLMLLSPIVMLIVFGGMFSRGNITLPELARPLMASGAFAFVFLMMINMVGNQFSFDRSGFRTYVLSPASRKDILLGKNLSMAPFVLGFMMIVVVLFEIRFPMRIDHLVGLLAQMVAMYLVFCLLGNLLSIIAPMPTAAGSMKPVKPKATTILIHMGFVFLFPIVLAPTLIPLGIEFLLSLSGSMSIVPVYMILAIVECATVLWLYPIILGSQGEFLQRRERRILETVTTKAE